MRIHYSKAQLRQLTRNPESFALQPLRRQAVELAEFLIRSGNSGFRIEDLRRLFEEAGLVNPETGEPLRPTLQELERHLQRAMLEGTLPVRPWHEGVYLTLDALETD